METIIDDVQIKSVIAWMPEKKLELSSLDSLYGKSEVESIIKATGIKRIRVAEDNMTASDMCYRAARALMEKEKISGVEIDGLVFVSQTCDYILPATSISLQYRLGLPQSAVCIDIHYGCSGYVYGLFQAAMWLSCGACKNVLILAGDTTSRLINPNDKSLRMVFGDCGTATLIGKGNIQMGFNINSDGSGADRLIVPAGGARTPISEETGVLNWDNDKNGRSQNDLFMDGMAIFNFAITKVPKNINRLIAQMQWKKEDVGLYALHQANNFMVGYIRKKLSVSESIVPLNAQNWGNTGPATIPLLLSDVCSEKSFNLKKVIMSGFGVGLSWGSVATSLEGTRFYKPINK